MQSSLCKKEPMPACKIKEMGLHMHTYLCCTVSRGKNTGTQDQGAGSLYTLLLHGHVFQELMQDRGAWDSETVQCGVVITITLIMSIQCNAIMWTMKQWNCDQSKLQAGQMLAKQRDRRLQRLPDTDQLLACASLSLLCLIRHKLVQQNTFTLCINKVLLGGKRCSWHLYQSSGFWFLCLFLRQMSFAWPFFRFLQIQLKYGTCHLWLCTCLKILFIWRQLVDVEGILFSRVQWWQFRLQQAKANVFQLLWWPKMWTGELSVAHP